MSKQIFPGGDLRQRQQEAAKEAAKQKAARKLSKALSKQHARAAAQAKKDKDKEMAMKMGPMARLMIVRRGLESFLFGMLLSVVAGSAHWLCRPGHADNIPYPAAFKRAYDIRNLGDKDTAFYPFVTLLIFAGAAAWGRKSMRHGKEQAQKVIRVLDQHLSYPSDFFAAWWFSKELNKAQNRNGAPTTPEEKMTPICRAIVAKYATEHRQFFDELAAGHNTVNTRDYAITVATAHLKSHPKDFNILKDAFYIDTLPKSLVKKYGAKQR